MKSLFELGYDKCQKGSFADAEISLYVEIGWGFWGIGRGWVWKKLN